MLTPLNRLSPAYHAVAGLLGPGWQGSYVALAVTIGWSPKCGRAIGRLVKSYARRNPNWPHERVFSQRTGRPAYEG
jgi:hypothetical protein